MNPYRHAPLPDLGPAQRQVTDELRRVERWSLSANAILNGFEYVWLDPYHTLNVKYDLAFDYGTAILFRDRNDVIAWGLGVYRVPGVDDYDLFVLVGTENIEDWRNLAIRHPVFIGGSDIGVEAGTSFDLYLPGVIANDDGYDLQLANDGRSVVAVPNPPPDWSDSDTSNSDGDILISGTTPVGWTLFPFTGAGQGARLEITVPAGTAAGQLNCIARVRITNTSTRTGTLTLGMSADGATPHADDQQTYVIPALYSGTLDLSVAYNMPADLTADVVLDIRYSGQGDHQQFSLETDIVSENHTFEARISYGGGGSSQASQVVYNPASSWLIATNVQAALDELAQGGNGGWYTDTIFTELIGQTAWVLLSPISVTPLEGNVNVATSGAYVIASNTPQHKCTLHAEIRLKMASTLDGPLVAFRFRTNTGVTVAGEARVRMGEFDQTSGKHDAMITFSRPVALPLASTFWGVEAQIQYGDSSGTLEVQNMMLRIEYT